jgi:lipopolysaccharide heptosyltransferase II
MRSAICAHARRGGFVNERILVIRLTALGDVILVEPVIRALRARFPERAIDLLTEARFASLGPAFFGADQVIGWDRHGEDRGLRGLSRVVERLPSRRYAAIVDLQNKVRSRMLAGRLDADRRVVMRKRSALEGIGAIFGRDRPIADRHTIDLYLAALAPLEIAADRGAKPRAGRPMPLFERGFARALIGLAPGATHPTKRWPIERFAELADRIDGAIEGAEMLLVGGQMDRDVLAAVRAGARRARIRGDDVTALDVGGLARAIASLDLLVGVDTGPAHLAAAIGVPVVAIFGPTSPVRWGPRGDEHRVVSLALECSPCSNIGGDVCPLPSRSHECMRGLGVDRVLEAALGSLRRS